MTGQPTSRLLPDKVSLTALHEIHAGPEEKREDCCWLQKTCCTVNYYNVITGRTSTRPTSDFTRPGAWSEKIGAGNVWVDLQESVRVVVTNHTYNTHLPTDRSQAGDRGAKPSLQAREDKKPSFVLKVIGVEREGSQELIQTTSHITGECRARLSDGGLAQQACCAARGKPAESGLALYTMYSMPSPGFRRHSGTGKIAYGNCRD